MLAEAIASHNFYLLSFLYMSRHDKTYSEAEMLDAFYAWKQFGVNALANQMNIGGRNDSINQSFSEWLEDYKAQNDIHAIDKVVEAELDARNEAE